MLYLPVIALDDITAWRGLLFITWIGPSRASIGNINSFHASVFLARQPMETGCPYPLNEDDPPVTRLVAMLLLATQAHAQVYHLHYPTTLAG